MTETRGSGAALSVTLPSLAAGGGRHSPGEPGQPHEPGEPGEPGQPHEPGDRTGPSADRHGAATERGVPAAAEPGRRDAHGVPT
ncbi:hypothetical protein DEJ25_07650 [Curtobacterium sp. MCPF17_011]|nr:hypothetical protein DEJ25_07650 [Curtobacterium sp. MCPF17_011]